MEETKDVKWVPNCGPQTDAYFCKADVLLYGGSGGGGKGLVPTTLVATPFGMKKIDSLKVGSRVLAADGTTTKVIGVYPQEKQQVYKVTFLDRSSICCDGPHLWNYSIASESSSNRRKWKVGTTKQLISIMESGKRVLTPVCSPLKFTRMFDPKLRAVDPYALGLLLGDGYTAQTGPGSKWSFTNPDKELLSALPGDWVAEDSINYRLRGEWRGKLKRSFKLLGLDGCLSYKKFVPDAYKWWTVENRVSILQGLMDSDGTITPDGKAYFTSTSRQLATDVRWLVSSLGGKATMTSRIPICTNGATGPVEGRRAWTLYIRMPDNSVLFRLGRKKDRARPPKMVKRKIVSIEPAGLSKTVCIAVDHPDSLYIAGTDLIVTHNTDLGLGLAITKHKRTLVMRRKYTDLSFITDRTIQIMGTKKGFNGSAPPKFNLGDDKLIEYGAAQSVGDEMSFQGRPHDLLYVDESAHFAESQIRALMGWVRSTEKGQRVRVVLGSNPPLSDEGNWMFRMFAPWLDPAFPEPAKGGELRHCYVKDGEEDIWVDEPGQYNEQTGEFVTDDREIDLGPGFISTMSRTFIPAKLSDNPFQNTAEYRAQQDGLPKHMRDAIRDGNFLSVRKDHDLQVIPTEWIKAAMDRWTPSPPEGVPMCAIAADLTGMGSDTGGGKQDKFVIASRHDGYYNELVTTKAEDAKMGKDKAAKIQKHRRDEANIILDMGGGYGDATYEHLFNNGIRAIKYKGAEKSAARTKASKIPFFNKRAETYYRFMEDLDPGQPGGSRITLPNDQFLMADLCSIRFDSNNSDMNMIKLETKKDLCKRLGRSTDYGDPVVMAWTGGGKIASHYHQWNKANSAPKVVMSKRSGNRRRR